ncbi:Lrp/AsnC family transcriptional regulator [Nocardiopsis sp. CC223A]|uniref:Lrp/AsnC family transcriptional regulator n=1 Tax=Nocardiopsis sp. CC223A TaxID=3044051 RepID=UPI00278C34F5|nr:Lrp/AsnC family transcriptional regulator [Nocardiopsis sp. CC223A]
MAAAIELDAIDWAILEQLQKDATIPNKQLAEQVGVAPSTCLLRVRRLRERGVITGIHAHVSSTAIGLAMNAILSVQVRPHTREVFNRFVDFAIALPETRSLYHVSGAEDFLIHVAVGNAEHLQQLVLDVMSQRSEVTRVQSSIVYEQTEFHALRSPDSRQRRPPLIAPRLHARPATARQDTTPG